MSEVIAIPALQDNYIWAWQVQPNKWAVVDPGAAEPVTKMLPAGHELAYILLTHHHLDHTGGVAALKQKYPKVKIYGPKGSSAQIDHCLFDGDQILGFRVIATPGHTLDHLIYVDSQRVFLGDHVFKYGCGRIFETDYITMYESLDKVKALPRDLLGYPAHEYTLQNLLFAKNHRPFAGIDDVIATEAKKKITLPLLISEQVSNNPFLACENFHEFSILRNARNEF